MCKHCEKEGIDPKRERITADEDFGNDEHCECKENLCSCGNEEVCGDCEEKLCDCDECGEPGEITETKFPRLKTEIVLSNKGVTVMYTIEFSQDSRALVGKRDDGTLNLEEEVLMLNSELTAAGDFINNTVYINYADGIYKILGVDANNFGFRVLQIPMCSNEVEVEMLVTYEKLSHIEHLYLDEDDIISINDRLYKNGKELVIPNDVYYDMSSNNVMTTIFGGFDRNRRDFTTSVTYSSKTDAMTLNSLYSNIFANKATKESALNMLNLARATAESLLSKVEVELEALKKLYVLFELADNNFIVNRYRGTIYPSSIKASESSIKQISYFLGLLDSMEQQINEQYSEVTMSEENETTSEWADPEKAKEPLMDQVEEANNVVPLFDKVDEE